MLVTEFRSKIHVTLGLLVCLLAASSTSAHDLFLRPASYHWELGEVPKILVFDGTFYESIYSVPRSSVDQLELLSPTGKSIHDTLTWATVKPNSSLWRSGKKSKGALAGVELRHTSAFEIKPEAEGSHLIGLTLREFRVALSVEDFSEYVDTEVAGDIDPAKYGFSDPGAIVRERFTKCAKTLIQVGKSTTDEAMKPMGLLVEIVPESHPARAQPGDVLHFQLLEEGRPIPNQPVIIGRKMNKVTEKEASHLVLRSNKEGLISLPVTHSGVWWLKFIRLQPTPEGDPMDFFSRWASLTFEIQ